MPVVPAAPPSIAGIATRVDGRLRELIDAEEQRWIALDDELGDVFVAIRALVLAGGKRLRPAFCHWGFVGSGPEY